MPSSGGASATGGSATSTGGAKATTGGSSGTTGGASTGGAIAGGNGGAVTGTGGNATTGGTAGATSGSAMFTAELTLSERIPTVGIVNWSIDVPIDSAYIEFGRDQNSYEYRAPVELSEPSYRTLLLGMKAGTMYYARITAQGGGSTYVSAAYPIETGFLPNGLPLLELEDQRPEALYVGGGFTVNCTGLSSGGIGDPGGGGDSYAFIFDKDGEQVWAYELTETSVAGCSRARMSMDGKSMWIGNFNNASTMGAIMRVSMDGLGTERTYAIRARNHDFALLPNGNLLYWEQQNGGGYTDGKEGPDTIREMNPETEAVNDIYDQTVDFAEQIESSQGSHTNQANYVPELGAISFSMRHTSTVGLISYPGGELLAVFGGPITTFSEMDWDFQHGHDVHANHVWIFNTNGSNGGSSVLGFQYDIAAQSSTSLLDYASGNSSSAFGDVKELPNGNLYVTYSTSGVVHEVSSSGELLREITTSASLGYSEHRATLYGPPPPFATE